jgi:regulator of sirC expression with transglutaminase-like and TPR domain
VSDPPPGVASASEAYLRAIGAATEAPFEIAEAALALASLDRPGVSLDFYHRHLAELARDLAANAPSEPSVANAAQCLHAVLAGLHGYHGDRQTYDDVQNANLMRVIDRRKGLPVALGVLFLHGARTLGWTALGLAFPGHFLIRLEAFGGRAILDPFDGGTIVQPAAMRQIFKQMAGPKAELQEAHYQPVGDRDVLLRLVNNIKSRALQQGDAARAAEVIERMLWLAPDSAGLHRELALIEASRGNLGRAIAAAEQAMRHAADDGQRGEAALLLQQLKAKLN